MAERKFKMKKTSKLGLSKDYLMPFEMIQVIAPNTAHYNLNEQSRSRNQSLESDKVEINDSHIINDSEILNNS